MKLEKLLLMVTVLLVMVPLASAVNVAFSCSAVSASQVDCTFSYAGNTPAAIPPSANFDGGWAVSLNVNQGSYALAQGNFQNNPASSTLLYNPTGNPQVNMFSAADLGQSGNFFILRFTGVATGSNTVVLNNIQLLDENSDLVPGIPSTLSSTATVGTACTSVTANCNRPGVQCPGNVAVPQVTCSGATPMCNPTTGQCEASPCTPRPATACTTGVGCPGNTVVLATGCTVTGQTCSAANICSCPTGQAVCGNACVNLQTDNSNCGTCGNICLTGQTCQAGACSVICTVTESVEVTCGDGIDNNCVGGTDCNDPNCNTLACVLGGVAGTCNFASRSCQVSSTCPRGAWTCANVGTCMATNVQGQGRQVQDCDLTDFTCTNPIAVKPNPQVPCTTTALDDLIAHLRAIIDGTQYTVCDNAACTSMTPYDYSQLESNPSTTPFRKSGAIAALLMGRLI